MSPFHDDLIEFLEGLEQSRQTVVLPAEEVERLVSRFGPCVRSMGFWDQSGDGSVEIPMNNITEAVRTLGTGDLADALSQLKSPERFVGALNQHSASRLIEISPTSTCDSFRTA